MELRALSSFVAVAEELHFGRAAARLHLSQPALSQQIKRLESELGVELLARDSRNVALTAAGDAFLDRCRAVLGDVAAAVDHVRHVGEGRTGRLRIGYVGSTLYGVVPAIVARFRVTTPGVELELIERKTAQQLTALAAGDQDVGLIHLPASLPDGIAHADVVTESLQLALPAISRAAQGEGPVALIDVAAEPVVLFPRHLEPDTYDRIMGLWDREGVRPRIAQHASGLHTMLGLVAAGVGSAFVTDGVAANLGREGIVCRPLRDAPTITTSLAWREPVTAPPVRPFVDVALEVADAGAVR